MWVSDICLEAFSSRRDSVIRVRWQFRWTTGWEKVYTAHSRVRMGVPWRTVTFQVHTPTRGTTGGGRRGLQFKILIMIFSLQVNLSILTSSKMSLTVWRLRRRQRVLRLCHGWVLWWVRGRQVCGIKHRWWHYTRWYAIILKVFNWVIYWRCVWWQYGQVCGIWCPRVALLVSRMRPSGAMAVTKPLKRGKERNESIDVT